MLEQEVEYWQIAAEKSCIVDICDTDEVCIIDTKIKF